MSTKTQDPLESLLDAMQRSGLDISVGGLMDAFWLAMQPGLILGAPKSASRRARPDAQVEGQSGGEKQHVAPDGSHVDATPAQDIRYLNGTNQPKVVTGPIPTAGPRLSRHKNPLDAWEIEGRAFSAKMIPAGQSAGGFFYFQTGRRPGARVYVTGLEEASSRRELLYFEFPLKDEPQ